MLIVIIRLQNILNQQIVVKKIVDVDCWVGCIEMEKNHSKKEDGRMNVMCKCFKTWMNRERVVVYQKPYDINRVFIY